ncbi:MAG: hypothetical protein QM742_08295 [Aquabacterium sp.]
MPGFLGAVTDAVANAAQNVVQQCQAALNPLPTPVAPTLAIPAPKIILVKKSHQAQGHRLRVQLGTTGAFTGTGTLTGDAARIRLFDSHGTALPLPYANIPGGALSNGVSVYVEAIAPSAALSDVTLTLTLTQGGEPLMQNPAQDTLTCVEVHMDLCQYKPQPGGADPAPLGGDARVTTGRNLHLQGDGFYAGRALLIVRQAVPAAYAGSVVLRGLSRRLRAFAYAHEVAANGQAEQALPLSTPNANIPGGGLKLWLEGAAASHALRDAELRLEISDLPQQEGDRAVATVVECTLDVGQSRVKPTTDPKMMPKARKLMPGRFLHVQDALQQFARAKVVVKRAKPSAFVDQMELVEIDVATGQPAGAPKLSLFNAETAGAAHATQFNQTGAYPPAGGTTDLWLEGTTVSTNLRDIEVRLRVTDAEGYADKVLFTVASMTQIQATINATPPNTPRPGVALPAVHQFTCNSLDPDFANNLPLVLMKNAQPDIALVLTAQPANLPISWAAVRNEDDHKDLGGKDDVPDVTAGANVYNATLDVKASGSFRIRAYIDNNDDDKYSPGEPSMPLNLVLARVHIVRDNSAGINGNLTAAVNGGAVDVRNGTWPNSWAACTAAGGAGMTMEIVADITGGGANGRLGLDKVFGGLVNMLTGNNIVLTYTDNTPVAPNPPVTLTVRNRYVTNRAAATGAYNGTPMFQPGDPAPALLAFPVLDTGRNPGGQGGETAVMGRSGVWDLSVDRTVGQRRTLRCIDSPGRGFALTHPNNANARLTKIQYVQQFRAHFCFWTNASGARGATGHVADRVYNVKQLMDWAATGEWNVTHAGGAALTVVHKHRIRVSGRRTVKPIGRAQDNGIEVRPPSGITSAIAWETT